MEERMSETRMDPARTCDRGAGRSALAPSAVAAGDESDIGMAQRVTTGDPRAFESIMRRHNRMLYRIARSILGNDEDAEDCLQSAYLVAFGSIGSFAGPARLSTWLAGIVINEALGRKRNAAGDPLEARA
jgi:RNA polymerase sigma-70 factor (ECF subfamily)